MKAMMLIMFLSAAVAIPSLSLAGSSDDDPANQMSAWSRFWRDVKDDWIGIGKEAKEAGTEVGRSVKEEFQEMPENFRKGYKEAREDIENGNVTPHEPPTDR